ncbi:MAG TPA: hypothetical protein VH143_30395 [Kofleriaceae bacterium]|jgi:hypothetical protein|nr:hypothetical protein [Kofleriaceae bacterium]
MKNVSSRVIPLVAAAIAAISQGSDAKTYKEPKLVAIAKADRPALPGPPPTIAISSPPDLEMIKNKQIERSNKDGMRYYEIDAVDPKETQLKLDVKNWKVSPRGNGIVLVLDNSFAAEIHDLSKPIDIVKVFDVRTTESPYGQLEDGWHFVAVFPVTANNIAVDAPGALAVVHFLWGEENGVMEPDVWKGKPQLVINRAALGTMVHRTSGGTMGGRVLRDPTHTPLDLLVWFPPGAPRDCVVPVLSGVDGGEEAVTANGAQDLDPTTTAKVKAPGLYYLSGLDQDRFVTGGYEGDSTIGVMHMECPANSAVAIADWDAALMRIWLK